MILLTQSLMLINPRLMKLSKSEVQWSGTSTCSTSCSQSRWGLSQRWSSHNVDPEIQNMTLVFPSIRMEWWRGRRNTAALMGLDFLSPISPQLKRCIMHNACWSIEIEIYATAGPSGPAKYQLCLNTFSPWIFFHLAYFCTFQNLALHIILHIF